jgi:hypothetical protein
LIFYPTHAQDRHASHSIHFIRIAPCDSNTGLFVAVCFGDTMAALAGVSAASGDAVGGRAPWLIQSK